MPDIYVTLSDDPDSWASGYVTAEGAAGDHELELAATHELMLMQAERLQQVIAQRWPDAEIHVNESPAFGATTRALLDEGYDTVEGVRIEAAIEAEVDRIVETVWAELSTNEAVDEAVRRARANA